MNYLGGYLMKKVLINWLLPHIIDVLIDSLGRLARKTSSEVDDALVATISLERDKILAEIKSNL